MTGWVNNFANVGGSAVEVAENTAMRVRSDFSLSMYLHFVHFWHIFFHYR